MGIRRFEDIQAWQEARIPVRQVYELTGDGAFAEDFGMRDQMRRASVSVTASTADGFDRESNIEFGRFLGIARRSAVEVQSLLFAALDVKYLCEEQVRTCYGQAGKIEALISGFKSATLQKN